MPKTFLPKLVAVVGIGLSLIACSPSEPPKAPSEPFVWLSDTPIGLTDSWRIAANPVDTGVWLAYYQEKSSLFLRNPNGITQMLVDGAAGGAPSGLALALNAANTPASMWRDKVPDKGLFLKQGSNPALEIGVNSFDTEPLARFDLAANGSKGWHVLWYGERFNTENNSKYNIYYRRVATDGALTPVESILPGFYPQWIVADDGRVSVFSWDNTQTPPKVVMRQQAQAEGAFSAPRALANTTPDIPPLFRSLKLGNHMAVMWIDLRGEDHRDMLLRGLWSKDQGANWSEFSFQGIRGFDIADFRLAYDAASGNALLTLSGTWRFKDPGAMDTFYVVRSADHGASWGEPQALRSAEAAKFSRATAAQAFFGSTPGETWVIWEDWRDVRGRLYFAYSADFGASWQHHDIPLAEQPAGNNILGYAFEQGYRDQLGQHLVAANVIGDAGTGKRLFSTPLSPAALDASLALHKKTKVIKDEKALKERVGAFRKALAESNYEAAYAFFDPFMRSAWPVELYKQRMGRIKYKPEIVIENVEIHGNFADVTSKIIAFVPPFEMNGKKQSMPEREISIQQRWVFVDGDWFLEYSEEGSEIRFTRYR